MIPQYSAVSCKFQSPHPDTGVMMGREHRYPIPFGFCVKERVATLLDDIIGPDVKIISIEFTPFEVNLS